jgi:transformation/transcription domain-associated protein
MGCYLEAIQIDTHEWSRMQLPKCLWMLTKDGANAGILCQTFESRGALLPPWVWLPWLPQLLTSFSRHEASAMKTIFSGIVKAYPQAAYYSLRAFYLEKRDVERAKSSTASTGLQISSVAYAEEMVSLLRKVHASLWSSLESILEELIKFRPLPEEEFLSPIVALLERAGSQFGAEEKNKEEESVAASIWKTLWRIDAKFFRPSDPSSNRRDDRAKKTCDFKDKYKESFETDFHVNTSDEGSILQGIDTQELPMSLEEFVEKLRIWQTNLEKEVFASPRSLSLIESSLLLANSATADAPDLWSGSCNPRYASSSRNGERSQSVDVDTGPSPSTTSSSASAAKKAAASAASTVAAAATREGIGGDFGGGSSCIEIPGQYMPNSSSWADCKPSPELHPKLVRFKNPVDVLRRSDQLVRRITMIGSDGREYRFLVQSGVPYLTRIDERTSQTYFALDKVLRRATPSARAHFSMQSQSMVPMAQRLRFVSEPQGRNSFEEIFFKSCESAARDPSEYVTFFDEKLQEAIDKVPSSVPEDEEKAENGIRLAAYRKVQVTASRDSLILSKHMYSVMESAEPYYHFRRVFAQQWAANCLMQYGFSVAERTPARVVFGETDGRVLSPEFRVCYSSQGFIETPLVPFRLTTNLANVIGFPLVDGRFLTSFATMSDAIREFKSELIPMMRLLMRDDLISFYTRSVPKSDSKTQEMEKQLADRIVKNAASVLARLSDCSPPIDTNEKRKELPVNFRVRELMELAASPELLCMMPSNFQAWL